MHSDGAAYGVNKDKIALIGGGAGAMNCLGAAMIMARAGESPLIKMLSLHDPLISGLQLDVPESELTEVEATHKRAKYEYTFQLNAHDWEKQYAEKDPMLFPGRMSDEDVAKLPMTIVSTGEFDKFGRDAIAFADRLKKAGRLLELSNMGGAVADYEQNWDTEPSKLFRA